MPFFYRISSTHTLSITRLHKALKEVVDKHEMLRTSVIFDAGKCQLLQKIKDHGSSNTELFTFIESHFETDHQLQAIIHSETNNSEYLDPTRGLVFRCHVVLFNKTSSNDAICKNDLVIFNFHNLVFDNSSIEVFVYELNEAYCESQLKVNQSTELRYLDCRYQ